MRIKQLMQHVIKTTSLTHIVLIIIAIIVFVGLFKREVKAWSRQNLPRLITKEVPVSYSCFKSVENPEYGRLESQIFDQMLDKCYSSLHEYLLTETGRTPENTDCESEFAGKNNLPKTTVQFTTCDDTQTETWLYAFGRYLRKI